uniref:Uncharacterized protein n=1 Tax=viral metagenome TaxID=1070528 RepID=A0A6C0BBP6_9ZZZZ
MTLTADYEGPVAGNDTGRIVIRTDDGTIFRSIETSEFFNIDFGNGPNPDLIGKPLPYTAAQIQEVPSSSPNRNDDNFKVEQRQLRILDIMKDGNVPRGKNIRNSVCPIMESEKLTFGALDDMENKFDQIMHSNMTPYSWTKISKDSELFPLLVQRIVSKESGLDTGYFINDPFFLGNLINIVVDPAGRSPIDEAKGDQYFLGVGETLVLTEAFLRFFGLDECRIEATLQADGSYLFQINVPGGISINKPMTTIGTTQVKWFQGNPEKNNFIAGLGSGTTKTNIKKGLLITKEMGDLGQVLLLFLWKLCQPPPVPPNVPQLYTMSTCDNVVMLQCMLMNLNCILTSAAKEDSEKLRKIMVFRPKTNQLDITQDVFNNEKTQIIRQNQKFIETIFELVNNPLINIYAAGAGGPITFPLDFYQAILNDLNFIQSALNFYNVAFIANTDIPDPQQQPQQQNVSSLNDIISDMKKNFLFNMFIRKPKDQLQMMMAKKYTQNDNLYKEHVTLTLVNYGKNPFYLLGKEYNARLSAPGVASAPSGGGIQKGGSYNLEELSVSEDARKAFTSLEFVDFNETPAWYYDENTYLIAEKYRELYESYLRGSLDPDIITTGIEIMGTNSQVDDIKTRKDGYFIAENLSAYNGTLIEMDQLVDSVWQVAQDVPQDNIIKKELLNNYARYLAALNPRRGVNLYDTLNGQIIEFLTVTGLMQQIQDIQWDFLNELYYRFYLDGAVLYDSELYGLIITIALEEFNIITIDEALSLSEMYSNSMDEKLQQQQQEYSAKITLENAADEYFTNKRAEYDASPPEEKKEDLNNVWQEYQDIVAVKERAEKKYEHLLKIKEEANAFVLKLQEYQRQFEKQSAAASSVSRSLSTSPLGKEEEEYTDEEGSPYNPSFATRQTMQIEMLGQQPKARQQFKTPAAKRSFSSTSDSDSESATTSRFYNPLLLSQVSADTQSSMGSSMGSSIGSRSPSVEDPNFLPYSEEAVTKKSRGEQVLMPGLTPYAARDSDEEESGYSDPDRGGKRRTRKYKRKHRKTVKRRKQKKTRKPKRRPRKTLKRRRR